MFDRERVLIMLVLIRAKCHFQKICSSRLNIEKHYCLVNTVKSLKSEFSYLITFGEFTIKVTRFACLLNSIFSSLVRLAQKILERTNERTNG